MATRWENKNMPFAVGDKPLGRPRGSGIAPRSGLQPRFSTAQLAMVRFWRDFQEEHGYPPCMRDGLEFFGFTGTKAISDTCDRLIRKGAMTKVADLSRGMVLTPLGRALVGPTGTVVQEQKCSCGRSHFTAEIACASCLRSSIVPKVVK